MMSCLLFDGVLGFHVQFLCHLVAVVSKKVIVKRLVVTGNGTADGRSMSCKDCCHLWNCFLQVQGSQARHPLMSLINDLISFSQVKTIKTFYNFTCCVREHGRFVIVTVCMKGIHAEILPHLAINGILFCKEREKVN